MLQRLVYSRFQLYQVNPDDLESAPNQPYPFCAPSEFRIVTVIDEPATQIVYEDWFKDNDVQWTTWTDAIHFVMQGSAEITYWEPPDLSDEPFRRLVADVPNPGFGAIAPPVGG